MLEKGRVVAEVHREAETARQAAQAHETAADEKLAAIAKQTKRLEEKQTQHSNDVQERLAQFTQRASEQADQHAKALAAITEKTAELQSAQLAVKQDQVRAYPLRGRGSSYEVGVSFVASR